MKLKLFTLTGKAGGFCHAEATKEKPVTEVTDFSVNLVLNQFPSLQQQYTRSKDQDAAEDREDPCAGAAGVREGCTRFIRDNKLCVTCF